MECDTVIIGRTTGGNCGDCHGPRRDDVAGGPRPNIVSCARGTVGPSLRGCVHPNQGLSFGHRLPPLPRHRTNPGAGPEHIPSIALKFSSTGSEGGVLASIATASMSSRAVATPSLLPFVL